MRKYLFAVLFGLFITPLFATGIDANATSADCDNATLGQYNGTANLEMDWQPNTINVRWYSDDTQLSVPTNAQTCSYDGALYLPTPPTKKGYTFEGWKVVDVPKGYTKLEYIQSTGTQYIDTGIKDVTDSEFGIVAQQTELMSSGWITLVGAQDAPHTFKVVIAYSDSTGTFYTQCGDGSGYTVSTLSKDTSKHTFKVINTKNSQTFIIDDTLTTVGNYKITTTKTYPLTIFARYYYSGVGSYAKQKVYSFYVKKNNQLVRKMIPVRRNSDNVLGMYDTVSGQFFTNSGTGTFIAGPVVQ